MKTKYICIEACVILLNQIILFTIILYIQVTTKEDFNIEAYMGKWFDIRKYPNSFQDGSCGIANYTLLADGTVKVNNTEIGKDGFTSTSIGQVTPFSI